MVSLSEEARVTIPHVLRWGGPVIRVISGAAVASEGQWHRDSHRQTRYFMKADSLPPESPLRALGLRLGYGLIPTVSHTSGAPPLMPTAGCSRFNQKPKGIFGGDGQTGET